MTPLYGPRAAFRDWRAMADSLLTRAQVWDPPLRRALHGFDGAALLPDPSQHGDEGVHPAAPLGVVIRMVQALAVRAGHRVLVVGVGTGHAAAMLAQLECRVTVVERNAERLHRVLETLRRVGVPDVHGVVGDGRAGHADGAPYDGILVVARGVGDAVALRDQLAPAGRLVALHASVGGELLVTIVSQDADGTFGEQILGHIAFGSRLGDLLVEMGAASREDVERAAAEAQASQRRIGEVLVAEGVVDEAAVTLALGRQRGLVVATVGDLLAQADRAAVASVPRTFLERHQVVPIVVSPDGTLTVATSNPDAAIADLLQALGARSADVRLLTPTNYRRLWTALDLGQRDAAPGEPPPTPPPSPDLLSRDSELDARQVALFDALLLDAIGERASDIHLERYGDEVRVRLRIDGLLHDLERIRLDVDDLIGVVNVVKIAAGLDIAERRLPQGGRIRRRAGGVTYDLRVQTQPALHGEHAVIRLLPQDARVLSVEELGFAPEHALAYRRAVASPAGLLLVVGPTGSGKSTTLYAALRLMGRETTRKVITVEDPIEYAVAGIQQTQVRPEIGFHFSDAMRSFVRQDPDVIMVGEIRDGETALEAIRASQTGHLVLSTLHCNDTVDAVQRLLDLGMHPNSIASELLIIIAQRLARRICDGCRTPATPEPEILAELFPAGAPADLATFRGAGCSRCSGHGTRGRVAVIEYLHITPRLREAITQKRSIQELRKLALASGMTSMRDAALAHVTAGRIPLAELPRILPPDRLAPETVALD